MSGGSEIKLHECLLNGTSKLKNKIKNGNVTLCHNQFGDVTLPADKLVQVNTFLKDYVSEQEKAYFSIGDNTMASHLAPYIKKFNIERSKGDSGIYEYKLIDVISLYEIYKRDRAKDIGEYNCEGALDPALSMTSTFSDLELYMGDYNSANSAFLNAICRENPQLYFTPNFTADIEPNERGIVFPVESLFFKTLSTDEESNLFWDSKSKNYRQLNISFFNLSDTQQLFKKVIEIYDKKGELRTHEERYYEVPESLPPEKAAWFLKFAQECEESDRKRLACKIMINAVKKYYKTDNIKLFFTYNKEYCDFDTWILLEDIPKVKNLFIKELNEELGINYPSSISQNDSTELEYDPDKYENTNNTKSSYRPNSNKYKIKELLDEIKSEKLSAKDIAKKLGRQLTYVNLALLEMLKDKTVKIVDFYSNNYNIYPIYQSTLGIDKAISIIEESSKEYKKLNLISVRQFCKEIGFDGYTYHTLLKVTESNNYGIETFYVHGNETGRGFFKRYKRNDLEFLKEKTCITSNVGEKPKVDDFQATSSKAIYIQNLLINNPEKTFTLTELTNITMCEKSWVNRVIRKLRKNNTIKIVNLIKPSIKSGSYTPVYQSTHGNLPAINIVPIDNETYITSVEVSRKYQDYRLEKAIRTSSLHKFYGQRSTTFNICYKVTDVEEWIKSLGKTNARKEPQQEVICLPDLQAQDTKENNEILENTQTQPSPTESQFVKTYDILGFQVEIKKKIKPKKHKTTNKLLTKLKTFFKRKEKQTISKSEIDCIEI